MYLAIGTAGILYPPKSLQKFKLIYDLAMS